MVLHDDRHQIRKNFFLLVTFSALFTAGVCKLSFKVSVLKIKLVCVINA